MTTTEKGDGPLLPPRSHCQNLAIGSLGGDCHRLDDYAEVGGGTNGDGTGG